jgi:hypothetical protein
VNTVYCCHASARGHALAGASHAGELRGFLEVHHLRWSWRKGAVMQTSSMPLLIVEP